MSKLWDMVDKDTKMEANKIIGRIKSDKIAKRALPNVSIDFPDDKALESFKALTKSEQQKKIIDSYYKAGDEGR